MFFQDFTFDTLLGCLSCILGVVALLVGTRAYKKCRIVESSLNDKKEFNGNSSDNSQRAARDIINNTCDVDTLSNITASNFEASLKMMYSLFEEKTTNNLYQIIEQTKRIIQDHKPNIAGLTKIDWINIYFESAKNSSNEYMQRIWAELLAKELETPGSFSYKTLDVLKNMSSEDFLVFEKLCSLEINGMIFKEDIHTKYGLSYLELVKLSEYGLLNMANNLSTIKISPNENEELIYKDKVILIQNLSEEVVSIDFGVYLLTTVARELLVLVNSPCIEKYAIDCVSVLSKLNSQAKVTLHRINYRTINGINNQSDILTSEEEM